MVSRSGATPARVPQTDRAIGAVLLGRDEGNASGPPISVSAPRSRLPFSLQGRRAQTEAPTPNRLRESRGSVLGSGRCNAVAHA